MSVDLVRRTMLKEFREIHTPTGFFSNMFKTSEQDIASTLKVEIDIKRSGNPYAVDVHRNSGGNFNKSSKFNTKEFEPPYFDEYVNLNAYEIFNRQVGSDAYQDRMMSDLVAEIIDRQTMLVDKIERAKEKMCSDILFSGAATFVNNTSIDYVMKDTHKITASAWSGSTAKAAVADLIGAAKVIRQDSGAVKTNTFNCIMGETSLSEFMTLLAASTSEYRVDTLGLADLQKTLSMGIEGATLVGKLVGGPYNFLIWSYPQYYLIPTGFGLSNEGTQAAYVPAEKVLVMPDASTLDFRMVYAGLSQLVPDPRAAMFGLSSIPMVNRGKWLPYFMEDQQSQCVIVGVRSAPLPIPVQIDGYAYINT